MLPDDEILTSKHVASIKSIGVSCVMGYDFQLKLSSYLCFVFVIQEGHTS